jgi:hypothetical protein
MALQGHLLSKYDVILSVIRPSPDVRSEVLVSKSKMDTLRQDRVESNQEHPCLETRQVWRCWNPGHRLAIFEPRTIELIFWGYSTKSSSSLLGHVWIIKGRSTRQTQPQKQRACIYIQPTWIWAWMRSRDTGPVKFRRSGICLYEWSCFREYTNTATAVSVVDVCITQPRDWSLFTFLLPQEWNEF